MAKPGTSLVTKEDEELLTRRGGPSEFLVAFKEYRELQAAIDAEMPEQIMTINTSQGPKKFRKKGYWRACSKAFGVDCDEIVYENRIDLPNGEFCYEITVRAKDRTGRSGLGDGACDSSEKKGKQKTTHNVRSHAITRAKNRAISDLVGFGEVSAEEMIHDKEAEHGRTWPKAEQAPPEPDEPKQTELPSQPSYTPTVIFGNDKIKGLPITELSFRDMSWYVGALYKSACNPQEGKEMYQEENQESCVKLAQWCFDNHELLALNEVSRHVLRQMMDHNWEYEE